MPWDIAVEWAADSSLPDQTAGTLGRTTGSPTTDPVLRSARPKRYWLTGHLLARQDYGLLTGQEHGVHDVPGR